MSIGHIVEYWFHSADGDLDCREGREWRAVRREIAEYEKGNNEWEVISVERVERHFYWRNHKGEPDGDFDNEYETIWTHPDWDEMVEGWKKHGSSSSHA